MKKQAVTRKASTPKPKKEPLFTDDICLICPARSRKPADVIAACMADLQKEYKLNDADKSPERYAILTAKLAQCNLLQKQPATAKPISMNWKDCLCPHQTSG